MPPRGRENTPLSFSLSQRYCLLARWLSGLNLLAPWICCQTRQRVLDRVCTHESTAGETLWRRSPHYKRSDVLRGRRGWEGVWEIQSISVYGMISFLVLDVMRCVWICLFNKVTALLNRGNKIKLICKLFTADMQTCLRMRVQTRLKALKPWFSQPTDTFFSPNRFGLLRRLHWKKISAG